MNRIKNYGKHIEDIVLSEEGQTSRGIGISCQLQHRRVRSCHDWGLESQVPGIRDARIQGEEIDGDEDSCREAAEARSVVLPAGFLQASTRVFWQVEFSY